MKGPLDIEKHLAGGFKAMSTEYAFPQIERLEESRFDDDKGGYVEVPVLQISGGMTLRDYFAAHYDVPEEWVVASFKALDPNAEPTVKDLLRLTVALKKYYAHEMMEAGKK